MSFFQKIIAWFKGEEAKLEAEIHDAIEFIRPRMAAYARNLEEVFGEQVEAFLKQAAPLIAQAAAQAIDQGLTGDAVKNFAKAELAPIALSLAKDTAHKLLSSVLNTTIELNHQEELAPPDTARLLGSVEAP